MTAVYEIILRDGVVLMRSPLPIPTNTRYKEPEGTESVLKTTAFIDQGQNDLEQDINLNFSVRNFSSNLYHPKFRSYNKYGSAGYSQPDCQWESNR